MTISLRLTDEESMLFKKYAELKNLSVSELIRRTVLDQIEDEYDLKAYQLALEEYRNHPVTYSLREVEQELGL